MNSIRQDAFDPKLQDQYRLQQALELIKHQDTVIAQQATRTQELYQRLKDNIDNSRKAIRLFEDATTLLQKNAFYGSTY